MKKGRTSHHTPIPPARSVSLRLARSLKLEDRGTREKRPVGWSRPPPTASTFLPRAGGNPNPLHTVSLAPVNRNILGEPLGQTTQTGPVDELIWGAVAGERMIRT
jgi:hypothetical protein